MSSLFGKKEKVQCSHILVKEKADADQLLADLRGGADFAAKAKALSQCPSGANGGDLGKFSRSAMDRSGNAALAKSSTRWLSTWPWARCRTW